MISESRCRRRVSDFDSVYHRDFPPFSSHWWLIPFPMLLADRSYRYISNDMYRSQDVVRADSHTK